MCSRILLLVVVLALPVAARAHDVYLTSGGVFEDVLAKWEGDQLRVRMPGGELRLARASVARVVETTGGQAEYLHRAEALRRSRAGAREWLELAQWARGEGLPQGAREAALEAAGREPRLAGLAPVLQGMGFVLDVESGRWISYEESMRRRGFVPHEGQWITREAYAELRRAEAEEAAERRAQRERERVERAVWQARLAAAELELERARVLTAAAYAPVFYPAVVVLPGFFVPRPLPPRPRPPEPPEGGGPGDLPERPPAADHEGGRLVLDITTRQPGSLFPARMILRERP